MNDVLTLSEVGFRSGNRFLLQNINWQIKQGERWLLFGLNGSGKTTLLSIIAGYQANTHGEMKIFNATPSAENILTLRKRIGFISSSFFDTHYSREIAFNIALSGKSATLGLNDNITDADVVKLKTLFRELHLERKMCYPYHILSKGERQRVLIARALINEPEILLLDEPFSGLDILARIHLMEMINRWAKRTDLTIIYVTHILEEILPAFDRCLMIQQGRIAACDLTQNIFTTQTLSALLNYPIEIISCDNNYYTVKRTFES